MSQKRQKLHHIPSCPVCQEQMIGVNIILCKNGHSQCESCQFLQEKCPICKVEYKNSLVRNFDLEKMIASFEDEIINCKFGCDIKNLTIGKSKSHYQICSKRLIMCPLAKCTRHERNSNAYEDGHFVFPQPDDEDDDFILENSWELHTNCPMIPFRNLKSHLSTHYRGPKNWPLVEKMPQFPTFYPFAFNPVLDDGSIRFFQTSSKQESFTFAIAMNRECTLIDVFSVGQETKTFKLTIRQSDCDFQTPSKELVRYAIGTTRPLLTDFKLNFTEVDKMGSLRFLFPEDCSLNFYLNVEF